MGLDYYNPNTLGRANESEIKIDGKLGTALIDNGAMILMMSQEYCEDYGYEIQPLDQLVLIEGSGAADVPYIGYVEVKMRIPGISSFEQDVLMLVSHTTTHFHQWVPFQVGSQITDQVVINITDTECNCNKESTHPHFPNNSCERYHESH